MKTQGFILFKWSFHIYDENKLVFIGGYPKDASENSDIVVRLDGEVLDVDYKTEKGIEIRQKYETYPIPIIEEVIGEIALPADWMSKKRLRIQEDSISVNSLKERMTQVEYNVERLVDSDEKLLIEGWAVDKNPVDIYLYDGEQKVDCTITRVPRRDVLLSFNIPTLEFDAGFRIEVSGVNTKNLRVVFETAEKRTVYEVKSQKNSLYLGLVAKVVPFLKRNGVKKTVKRVLYKLTSIERFNDVPKPVDYEEWITEVEALETYDEKFSYNPKISIVVPVYNVLDKHLIPCIESVMNQIYENWELCLADDCSTMESVRQTLSKYENNEKIKIVYREENGHISRCTNSAIELATGEFVAFMDCDDVLRPNALYEVVKRLNENPELDFIYSDEDKIDDDGKNRHMPHFKPDWSPDTLMSHMYTCHFGVYRRSIVNEIGGLRAGVEGSQDYDFTLRFTEKTDKISHISKILYHWREREESTAINPGAKPYILEAARKTKQDALNRRGLKAELELIDHMYQYRVNYISQTNPLISIIIPSKDNFEILERCIKSLYSITEYKNFEVVLVDNGSNETNKLRYAELANQYDFSYFYEKMEFNFSKMCNIGAKHAKGEYLLFLNDDIEIIHGDWLDRMIGHAELEHIGAVGAKLLYPGGKMIQHIGVVEIANGPIHGLVGGNDENLYYFGRNRLDYNWLAVTAACMLVKKSKFEEIGGFDEQIAVTYNDVELCFKLIEAGYYNVVRNDVVLYHHESISRGNDLLDDAKLQRLLKEQARVFAKHPQFDKKDPFYNIHLTQHDVNFDYNYKLAASILEAQAD